MNADSRARAIAARQEGMIACHQLRAAGLTHRQIHVRARRGELIRRHQGVYQMGGSALNLRPRVWGALLACGPTAFASHRTAAVLWGLRRREPEVIDVSFAGTRVRRLEGVRVHRLAALPTAELRTWDGIRLSAPSRAICELAATVSREEVEYAIQEAAARRLLIPIELRHAVERWGSRPGAAMLAAILQVEAAGALTRSRAERRLRWIVARAGLAPYQPNERILGHLCDAVWREQHLIVEVDGIGTHGTPVAFAADRAMDVELTLAGWRVLRFTARELRDEPMRVAAQLARALA